MRSIGAGYARTPSMMPGTSASETAPFLPIEQAIVPQIVPAERRTAAFARYNLVASFAGALGALAAGSRISWRVPGSA